MTMTTRSVGPHDTVPLTRILDTITGSAHAEDTTGDDSATSPLPYTALVTLPILTTPTPDPAIHSVIAIDHPGQSAYDLIHGDTYEETFDLFSKLADAYVMWRDYMRDGLPLLGSGPVPTLGTHPNPLINAYFARLDAALEPLRAKAQESGPLTFTIARDVREYTSYTLDARRITPELAVKINTAVTHPDNTKAVEAVTLAVETYGVMGATTHQRCDDPNTAVLTS